jgi:predicted O-methyltransferase YrrM
MVFTAEWDWFSGYIDAWKTIFKETKVPERILEIGSFEGRSACWLLENTNAHVTCVDTWEGSDEHNQDQRDKLFERFKENIEPFKDRVTIVRGESGVMLRTLPCEPTFDFVYIDGSHYAKDVLEDAVLVWRLVKPGGIVVFDDYNWNRDTTGPIEHLDNPRSGIHSFISIFQPKIFALYNQAVIQKV